MRRATDTTLRHLATLTCIPVHPRTKTTREIAGELFARNSEYDVSVRSVQRSLETLSGVFPITADRRGRANHWCWTDAHALTQIPAMSEQAAFVLRLASDYLKPLMPGPALRRLTPYFDHAEKILDDTKLGRWSDRARIIERGPTLTPPSIPSDVQDVVYTALMDSRQVAVDYRSKAHSRARRIVLNPLGIVVRAGIVYLVATSWNYQDVRHYVLHRMAGAELQDQSATTPPGFRLADHIHDDQRFSYPQNPGKLELRALFAAEVAVHLTESSLAPDHRTTAQADGRVLVEATVADTADLRWWLLSFGAAAEVLAPASLRTEFRDQTSAMQSLYQ